MPEVSIIMCAYNVAGYIERAIQSIVNQVYQDWELVLVDDASTDGTVLIIQKYLSDKRIKLFQQPVNVGYIPNKNFAFGKATGSLLTQLDADDTCHPQRLLKQVSVFEHHPEVKICGSNYCTIDMEGNLMPPDNNRKDGLIYFNEERYPFWFPNLMFKKEVVDEFGLFSEYFNGIYGDDYFWTMRVNQKYPIYYISDVLYHYRMNPDSLTNTFNNPRKLIVEDILKEVKRQRLSTGSDWISDDASFKMNNYEASILNNPAVMGEKYRIWAAKSIDKHDLKTAFGLLKKSVSLAGFSSNTIRTIIYFLFSLLRLK